MAIESGFIREDGPFVGTSCMPWRQRGQGIRSPLAVNVDFTRGTIRARQGVSKFFPWTTATGAVGPRVMGMTGYRKRDGESLVVIIKLVDNPGASFPWQLEFEVYNMRGVAIADAVRLDQHPFAETPDPDNWYTFCQYNNDLYIASRRGRVMRYNYEKEIDRPAYVEGFSDDYDIGMLRLLTYPQGSILAEHSQHLVVGGFDGETWHRLQERLRAQQNLVDEESVDFSRQSIQLKKTEIIISEAPHGNMFQADRIINFPSGGSITGLASTRAGVLVLTERDVHLVNVSAAEAGTDIMPTVSQRVLMEGVDCVGPRTVVRGKGFTAWIASDGIYMFDGQKVQKISDDLEDLWSSGRWNEPPIVAMGVKLSELGYPFVLQKSRMDRAVGTFDPSTNTFIWAVPLAGYADYNRLILVYYPTTDSWALYTPQTTETAIGCTAYRITNFAQVYDRTKSRVIFSDYNTGLYGFNESQQDYVYDAPTGEEYVFGDVKDVAWAFQAPFADLGAGVMTSAKALQVRQSATGSANSTTTWYVETERNFDMDQDELGATGDMTLSPRTGPPNNETTLLHRWDQGRWLETTIGGPKWHRPGTWRARYPVAALNGNGFKVGFAGTLGAGKVELYSYALESQQKRDVT